MKANKLKRGRNRIKTSGIVRSMSVLLLVLAVAILAYFYLHSHPLKSVPSFFPIRQISFIGNRHITDDELRQLSGVHLNDSLLMISGSRLSGRLLKSPWIRSVSLRKEYPGTLSIAIKEAEPFALLDMNNRLFLLDGRGNLLEELRGDSVPFLPVITGDPYNEKEGLSEGLKLARLLNEKGFSSETDRLEIVAHKPTELSVKIDGILVKVGAGEYEEKIERLIKLEKDIKGMGVPIDYIDLRFERKAIVKPMSEKVLK
jgi:cell division protein FtsQ